MRLMSESARGEGGRIWVYGDSAKTLQLADGHEIPCGKTGEPWYFLEETIPSYLATSFLGILVREKFLQICEMGLGVDGSMQVYLDVSHLQKKRKKNSTRY